MAKMGVTYARMATTLKRQKLAHLAWRVPAESSFVKCARRRVLSIVINAPTTLRLISIQASVTVLYVMWSTVSSVGRTVQTSASNAYQRSSLIELLVSVSFAELDKYTMKLKDNALSI